MSKKITKNMEADFNEILLIIEKAKENAFRAINHELISMYWEIGKYISERVKSNAWGKSVVEEFSVFIQRKYLGIKGFSMQNVWRMKQFYETYKGNEFLSTLSREISWSNNVIIMSSAKTDEAREFYLTLTIKNNYSARELERQMDSMLFERTMISNKKNELFVAKNSALSVLRDNYTLEFLVENPSVGLILCAAKDDTVVEYALSRSVSSSLVADYKLHLPDKKILENKLRELRELAENENSKENKK